MNWAQLLLCLKGTALIKQKVWAGHKIIHELETPWRGSVTDFNKMNEFSSSQENVPPPCTGPVARGEGDRMKICPLSDN